MNPNQTGTIIFDFDGTLADTKAYVLEALNQFAKSHRLAPVEDIADMRSVILTGIWRLNYRLLSLRATLKKLVLDNIEKNIDSIDIQPTLPGCIEQLAAEGYRLGILTTNRSHVVRQFLRKYHLEEYFSFIRSADQKDKALAKLIRQQKLSVNNLFYVGDQATDILATKSLTHTIAVTWGYESETLLSVPGPAYTVASGKELELLMTGIKQQHLDSKISLGNAILRAEPIKCTTVDEIFSKITCYPTKKYNALLSALAGVKKSKLQPLTWQFMSIIAYDQLFEQPGVVKPEIASALGSIFKDTPEFRHQLLMSFFKYFILPRATQTITPHVLDKCITSILDPEKRRTIFHLIPRRLRYFDHSLQDRLIDYFYDRSRLNFEKALLDYSNDEELIDHGFSILNEMEYIKRNKASDPLLLIKCLNNTTKMMNSPTSENCQACQSLGVQLGYKPLYQRLGGLILNLVTNFINKLSAWWPWSHHQETIETTTGSLTFFKTSKYKPIKYQVDDLVAARVKMKI